LADLRAPFVYFGGKSKAAEVCWQAFDPNVPNYCEPFAGSVAVLLKRPAPPRIESINDIDCDVANFWRAVRVSPDVVAEAADWPVNEADLHARCTRLLDRVEEHRARMHADPDYFDAERAGIWCWGQCTAIGGNWMNPKGNRALPRICGWIKGNGMHALPSLGHSGRGIHRNERADLIDWMRQLAARLRKVRVACGEWSRILSGAVTGASNSLKNMGMSPCAVLLDPPYPAERAKTVYTHDDGSVAFKAREWALEHGDDPHFRIALCGYEGDFDMPPEWTVYAWKAQGGHANRNPENKNRHRERIWFSRHCLPIHQQRSLFSEVGS
jgi:D12 class N6 adenine-specific DNA methyltransferase